MKKKGIIAVVLIIVVAWTVLTVVQNYDVLRSQLLGVNTTTAVPAQSVENCQLMAETAANDCLLQLAIAEKDDAVCDSISKPSQREKCQREVELTQ